MTTLIIFVIVLAVLIFVHELGHFLSAKATGMRVDEFAVGFPPKIFAKKVGETLYAINLIPFGGYVKIFGEDLGSEEERVMEGGDSEKGVSPEISSDKKRSFVNRPKWAQALVLISGILGNLILAWLLLSFGFMSGLPTSASRDSDFNIEDPKLVVTSVFPDSPAEKAGLKPGDEIRSIRANNNLFSNFEDIATAQRVISRSSGELVVAYQRGEERDRITIETEEGILEDRRAIGVSLDMIGIAKLPFLQSLYEGAKLTVNLSGAVAVGLGTLIADAFRGSAELSQVTGPVGIAGLLGDASRLGFAYLASFTAFISINLALLNLIPFPALDGGRLLFVAIEAVSGRRINPKISSWINIIGFGILILLMIIITFNDVLRLF